MPIYHKLGKIPPKRHTVFGNPKGGIYYEQLFGTEGFNSHSSLLYEIHRPTQVKEILASHHIQPEIAISKNIKSLLLSTFNIKPENDFLESRKALFINADCVVGVWLLQLNRYEVTFIKMPMPMNCFLFTKEKEN